MDPVIVIGGGHNGLTAAFYLARAGLKPLVLERRPLVGGAAVTETIAPGYRCPTLAHTVCPLAPDLVRDMQLARRGVEFVQPDPRLVALSDDGRALVFSTDVTRTADAIRAFSARDAERYPAFGTALSRLGGFLSALLERRPPSLEAPAAGEIWDLLTTGRRFRALGRQEAFRLLRWGPMAAADLVGEWFESDLLLAPVAARGIFGTAQGPWSAGTGALLLLNAAVDAAPGGSSLQVKGGPGHLTKAMADAAKEAGADIRTAAPVARVLTRDGRAAGVVLADGTEIAAAAVVSNADPRRTLLGLVDPADLDPGFLTKVRNYRSAGTVAKVNIALGALPTFRGVGDATQLRGRIHIGPAIDYLERAFDASKYGGIPDDPYLDITIPTLVDPALAAERRHVMSACVQFVPYRLRGGWNDEARTRLADTVVRTLERYAPGIGGLVVHRQVLAPDDLEREYALTGGHIYHGEPSLDQLFAMRPILGWAQYRTPIDRLYLCGAGTHGGLGITGGPGRNAVREILKDLRRRA